MRSREYDVDALLGELDASLALSRQVSWWLEVQGIRCDGNASGLHNARAGKQLHSRAEQLLWCTSDLCCMLQDLTPNY